MRRGRFSQIKWDSGVGGGHTPGKWQVLSFQHKSWALRAQATPGLNRPLYSHSLHCGVRKIPPNWGHDSSIHWEGPRGASGPQSRDLLRSWQSLSGFRTAPKGGRRRVAAAAAPQGPSERKRLSHREAGTGPARRGGWGPPAAPALVSCDAGRPHLQGCREPPLTWPEELSQRRRRREVRRGSGRAPPGPRRVWRVFAAGRLQGSRAFRRD